MIRLWFNVSQHLACTRCSINNSYVNEKKLALKKKKYFRDFPGGPVAKNPPGNAGDTGWIPSQGIDPTCLGATTEPEHHKDRVCARQQKILHDATKIPCAQ